VLSYALGLFSARTTLAENVLSTALGAAPFALLFALVPTWPAAMRATRSCGTSRRCVGTPTSTG